jgi:citrate synthase
MPLGDCRHRVAIRLADVIATICSSVKRALRIAPSESGASLSRNQWSEIPGAGHRVLNDQSVRHEGLKVG